MSGSSTQHPQASRYDKGKTYDSGFKYDSYTLHKPKRVIIKVYNSSDTFLGLLDDVVEDIQITKKINGGLEPLTIKTKKTIDNFDQGSLVNYKNIIRIYLTDAKNTDQIIYTGFISSYEPYLTEEGEGTNIQVLPNIAQIAEDFFRVGTTLEITKSSMEISLVVQDIIEKYQEKVTTALVTYPSSIRKATGNTISYTFKAKKTLDAIKKCTEFLDNDWYWYVQPNGQLKIDQESATADITLTIGRNIKSIRTRKTIERVVNKVIFWNGREANDPLYIYNDYNNASSQSSYGIRSKFIKDGRVTVSATADLMANRIINKYKDPKIITEVEITQNGINLATIEPGQTVNIRNIDTTNQTTFDDGLVIARVDYDPGEEIARLELADTLPDIALDIEEDIDLKLDRLVQDLEDRLNDVPNTQLKIRVRSNTAIVATDGTEQFTDIQEAIDYVSDQGGGVVLVRAGVYSPSSAIALKPNIVLKGEGIADTIITGKPIQVTGAGSVPTGSVDVENGSKVVTGNSTTWISDGVEAGHVFFKTSARRDYIIESVDSETQITLKTAYQEATDTTMGYTILRAHSNFAILDLRIENSDGGGFVVAHGRNFLVNNIQVVAPASVGIEATFSEVYDISENLIEDIGQSVANKAGINIANTPPSSDSVMNIRSNQILRSVASSGGDGIEVSVANLRITDNICKDQDSNGITLLSGAENCIVIGNRCEGNGVYGVRLSSGADNNTVTGNQLAGNTTASLSDGGAGNVTAGNVV